MSECIGTITSIQDFGKQLLVDETLCKHYRYFYRGEPGMFDLLPKLARKKHFESLSAAYNTNDLLKLEDRLLTRFRRFALHWYLAGEHRPCAGGDPSRTEWLCVAQHHGLPTLLLDWTLSPLVGLYYAAGGFTTRDYTDEDGRLWVMELLASGLRETMTIEMGSAENYNDMKKLDGPVVVLPWAFTQRIDAQAGRFTYSGFDKPDSALHTLPAQIKRPWSKLNWIRIPSKKKKQLLSELDRCLIHEATLFPDLDGCARYFSLGGRWGRLPQDVPDEIGRSCDG